MGSKVSIFLRLFRESWIFAYHAIIVNKLRTLLSLLGITIGIFAIIAVFSITDSMERQIRNSVESLGSNVLYIQKWPWGTGGEYPWWKYWRRPVPTYSEMKEIKKRSNAAESVAFFIAVPKTIKHKSIHMQNANIICVSDEFENVWDFDIGKGRYITESEYAGGHPVCVLGSKIEENLFKGMDAVGKEIKVFGRNLEVIGIFQQEGNDMFGNSVDEWVVLPINFVRSIINLNREEYGPNIIVKAKVNIENDELRDELTGVMRSIRKLKPSADDNFAINETDLISQSLDSLFKTLNFVGTILGLFSILVGGFGIANIMFVSVKERTNQIGIKKAMGAKRYIILLEFLFESVFLCLLGGMLGLILVYFGTLIVSNITGLSLILSQKNIFTGIIISIVIGVVSGIIPAYIASRLHPVDAIRTGM